MNLEIKHVVDEFHKISKKGWIKTNNNNSFGSVGLTFENELNKKADSMYFPDYYGVEIKCTTFNSKYPIFLFTTAFDGPTFPEINRIVEKYGRYDFDYPDKKTLFAKLNFTTKTLVNSKWYFKLSIDDDKVFLEVYDLNKNLIEKKSFVYINTLYNHIMLKLQKMAVIYALQKRIKDKKYFYYYKIDIYQIKSFDKFISLLKKGLINVSLISRISKSGKDAGRYRNKNLVFEIKKDRLYYLFDRLYYYNSYTKKEIRK